MPERIIHVVDDDEAMRDSLDFLLGAAGYTVRAHENAQALLDQLPSMASDLIVTDIRMPGLDGIELLKRVKAAGSPIPVIVMTGHGDIPLAVEAMKLGAADFIEKPFEDQALLKAIESACETDPGVPSDPSADEFKRRLSGLTSRERQVFDGLVSGHANKVIARDLEISPRTVEVYRANVMTKLAASGMSELVRMAVRANVA